MKNTKQEINVTDLLKYILKNKMMVITYTIVAAVLGVVVAISIPREYSATSIINPESNSAKSNLGGMGDFAGMMGMDLGNSSTGLTDKVYPVIVSSAPFLMDFANIKVTPKDVDSLISLYQYITQNQKTPWWSYITRLPSKVIDLFKEEKKETLTLENSTENEFTLSEMDNIFCKALAASVTLDKNKTTGLITMTVTSQDPSVTKQLSDSVITKLEKFVVTYYTSKARKNLSSSVKMLQDAKNAFYEVDRQYAEMYDKNSNLNLKTAEIKVERLKNERDLTYSIYQQIARQVEMDKIKLQDETPVLTVIDPPVRPLVPSKPKKSLIVIVFAFLGGICAVARLLQLYSRSEKTY